MDNISQIISRSIGGYSIGSILSALLTFLICLIVVRLVLKLCSRLLSRANRLNERLQKVILTSLKRFCICLPSSSQPRRSASTPRRSPPSCRC